MRLLCISSRVNWRKWAGTVAQPLKREMKQYKSAFVIFLFCGIVYGQDHQINQTEEMDIANIQERAKADAKSDFTTLSKLGWFGTSFVSLWGSALIFEGVIGPGLPLNFPWVKTGLIAPPVLAGISPVKLREYREKELLSRSTEYYAKVYRAQYISQIKIQRIKYLLAGEIPTLLPLAFILGF